MKTYNVDKLIQDVKSSVSQGILQDVCDLEQTIRKRC